MPQSKQCVECGAKFTRPPNRSHAQWAMQQCCSRRCANAVRARGRLKMIGDLSRTDLGSKAAWNLEWQRRKAMPRWAAWWEAKRRDEDLADLAIVPTVYGRGAQRIKSRPGRLRYIAGWCPDCGEPVVVVNNRWHDCIRCLACNKKRWRQNHKQRAERYGVAHQDIITQHVFQSDKWICQLCGKRTRQKHGYPNSATLDHIVPLSQGGSHTWDNVQTACARCNFKKGIGAANDQMRLPVHLTGEGL